MRKNKINSMSDEELKQLALKSDEDIDYSDIPETTDLNNWKRLYPDADKDTLITDKMMFEALARVFEESETEKVPVTLKLDRKVIEFFKQHSKKYQVKINDVLMEFVNTYKKVHHH